MTNIKQIIEEAIQGYKLSEKKSCSCGCNSCHDKKKTKLNESKERIKKIVKEQILTRKRLKEITDIKEETVSTIFKLEGILVTDTKGRNQTDILSDIRSISGVTIVGSKEIRSDQSTIDNSSYFSYLTVKIDPHPFIGKGGFGKEEIKLIYNEIKRVTGVKSFRLKKKPQRI